ncbi:MAG: hypothetical protein OXI01_15405 [Albidovulum sp.]|nr:hypothetical protein [Albidovulum sp.]
MEKFGTAKRDCPRANPVPGILLRLYQCATHVPAEPDLRDREDMEEKGKNWRTSRSETGMTKAAVKDAVDGVFSARHGALRSWSWKAGRDSGKWQLIYSDM